MLVSVEQMLRAYKESQKLVDMVLNFLVATAYLQTPFA